MYLVVPLPLLSSPLTLAAVVVEGGRWAAARWGSAVVFVRAAASRWARRRAAALRCARWRAAARCFARGLCPIAVPARASRPRSAARPRGRRCRPRSSSRAGRSPPRRRGRRWRGLHRLRSDGSSSSLEASPASARIRQAEGQLGKARTAASATSARAPPSGRFVSVDLAAPARGERLDHREAQAGARWRRRGWPSRGRSAGRRARPRRDRGRGPRRARRAGPSRRRSPR